MNTNLIKTIDSIYKNLSNDDRKIYCTIETKFAIYTGQLISDETNKYDLVHLKNSSIIFENNSISSDDTLINISDIKSFSYKLSEYQKLN